MNQNGSEQNHGEGPGILIGIVVAIIVGIIIIVLVVVANRVHAPAALTRDFDR